MEKTERKRTTLYLEPKLWERIKIEAIRRGIDATVIVNEALKEHLSKKTGKGKP